MSVVQGLICVEISISDPCRYLEFTGKGSQLIIFDVRNWPRHLTME